MSEIKAPQAKVCVGEITAPHGVRGLLRLRSFTEVPDAVFGYKLMRNDGTALTLEKRGVLKEFFFVAITGVDTLEAAEAWRGVKIYTDRAALPETGESEYYLADLKGLIAQLADGTAVGTVIDIYDFGAGTMLEIKRKGAPSLLLPFDDDFVPQVNIAAGVIKIVMPIEVNGEQR